MAWYLLLVAGLFEIAWAIGLEYSEGLTRPVPTAATGVAMLISVVLLAKAVETLPVGTAYAVWTGVGAVGTAALGIGLFDEPLSAARVAFVGLIVVGIVGLNVTSGAWWSSSLPIEEGRDAEGDEEEPPQQVAAREDAQYQRDDSRRDQRPAERCSEGHAIRLVFRTERSPVALRVRSSRAYRPLDHLPVATGIRPAMRDANT
jgi:quaternary ammonium compound-resistance protein SugE